MNIQIENLCSIPLEKQKVEIVERKGIGHPDSIADGLAESVSRALCKEYLNKFGYILHHNTDEVQIVGGQSAPQFGGGVILQPVYILLVGRATSVMNGTRLPVRSIAIKAARNYLSNFPNLDPDTDVMLDCKIQQGSQDLRGLYDSKKGLANDTSIGVGYAPFTETETITLELEKYITTTLRTQHPEVGEDVKVMSYRAQDTINITVAMAMVDRYIPNPDHYISIKEELVDRLTDQACNLTNRDISLKLNTGDDYDNNIYYLTVTGLSMENGDDGSVGRGNRVNGLITANRPASMEAAAGKNPVTHVGKLYNLASTRIAQDIVDHCASIEEAYIRILSQIGKSITDPQVVSVGLVSPTGFENDEQKIRDIVQRHLTDISALKEDIMAEKLRMF